MLSFCTDNRLSMVSNKLYTSQEKQTIVVSGFKLFTDPNQTSKLVTFS